MKKLISLLLCLLILACLPLSAAAHDVPQDRTDCTVEILVKYNGQNITGGTLTAVRVGYVDDEDGNYYFYQMLTNTRLEEIDTPKAAEDLADFYTNNKSAHTFYTQTQSVKDGKATFSGLHTGLYLITQEQAATGYSKLKPFLVSVPMLVDGKYEYNVTAAIKSELEQVPTTVPPTTKPGGKLPQTGQLNWPVPVLAVSGLALFLAGWILRRKKESYEA